MSKRLYIVVTRRDGKPVPDTPVDTHEQAWITAQAHSSHPGVLRVESKLLEKGK